MPLVNKPGSWTGRVALAYALVADIALILLFVVLGRETHDRANPVLGALATAWPFLAGAAAGWLVSRNWRTPVRILPNAVVIWLSCVVVGMLLRAASGAGIALAFQIVAFIVLGVFLLGHRLVAAAVVRRRTRATAQP